jgi:hypothetical protein
MQKRGYGRRFMNIFAGTFLGLILFLSSIVVLFINENQENLATYARQAVPFDPNENQTGLFVYHVGMFDASIYASDAYLVESQFIYIERVTEMYGYIEEEHHETRQNYNGTETRITTYTYHLDWVSIPKKSTNFRGSLSELPTIPERYDEWIEALPEKVQSEAQNLTIDGIDVATLYLTFINPSILNLKSTDVKNLGQNESVMEGFIFKRNTPVNPSSPSSPNIGDYRTTYKVITNEDQGILFALYENEQFEHLKTPKDNIFYLFMNDITDQNLAVTLLNSEHQESLWILRFIAFIMMFIGLNIIAVPIMKFISILPFFENIKRTSFILVALIISVFLIGLMILFRILFNDALLALFLVASTMLFAYLYLQSKHKKF